MSYGIVGYSGHNLTLTQLFAPLKIGGGGFMRMLDINPDGTMLCASDVYGCWMWNTTTSQWDSLLTGARGFSESVQAGWAAYDMASAPSNSSVIYIYLNDSFLYRSLDHGATFVKLTQFPTNSGGGTNNGSTRFNGRRIAIDPINPDVVYVGAPSNGVYVTSNGSQGSASTPTFSLVSGITAASDPAGYNLCFDPNSGTTSGKTNVMCIFSNGTGMYKATSPLGAFTLTTGGPTTCSRLVCSQKAGVGSNIFYVANDTSNIFKFASGSWSQPAALAAITGTDAMHSIAIDPADNTRIFVADPASRMFFTTDGGTTWALLQAPATNSSPTIPWLALTEDSFKTNADIIFDPSKSNTLLLAEGIGIFTMNPPNGGANVWTAQTAGIENLQTNAICASPSVTGTPITACWDRHTFYIADPNSYPATQGPNNIFSIQACWDLDWASSDQKTIVGIALNNTSFMDASGTSANDGQTWTFLPPSSNGQRSVTTTGPTAAGGNTISSVSPSFGRLLQMQISNATHPTSIPAGTYITGGTGSTLTLSQNIQSPGIGSGDTLNISFPSSPNVVYLQTNASTAIGSAVLHFASTVPSSIKVGMIAADWDNNSALNFGGQNCAVLSISGSTVTLNIGASQTINSGDIISFAWGSGGCTAASSPSNFMMCGTNDTGFPYVTADAGATWNAVDIAGAPRPLAATFNGTTTALVSDTSNLVVGTRLSSALGLIPNGTTVASITDSTHFVMSASIAAATDVIYPESGWGHANTLGHKLLAADRVTANKFYAYNYMTGSVYVSTLSGANGTWSVANSVANGSNATNLRTATNFNMTGGQGMAFKSVPGQAGHLFASNANVQSGGNNLFIRSTDGGVNWSSVANVSGVHCFGFGKANPAGGTYPAVFIVGTYNGQKGVFRSDDNCASFVTVLARNSYNILDGIDMTNVIEGDKNTFGKFYISFTGNGCAYGYLG